MRIKFNLGGEDVAIIEIWEDKVPQLAAKIADALPFATYLQHGKLTGDLLLMQTKILADWENIFYPEDLAAEVAAKGTEIRAPVAELLRVRLANSATVVLIALVITLPLGLLLGLLAARRAGSALDVGISGTVQVILSLPEFVVGIILVVLFGGGLFRLLPPTSPLDPRISAVAQPRLLVLPIATMVLIALPHLTEATKTLLREELAGDYVRWARLSGLGDARLLARYALPNTWGPVAQIAGVTVNYLLGGVAAVETVFAFPGIGSELVSAVGSRDIVVVQVIAMGIATILLVTFLVADLVGLLTNPRLRSSR